MSSHPSFRYFNSAYDQQEEQILVHPTKPFRVIQRQSVPNTKPAAFRAQRRPLTDTNQVYPNDHLRAQASAFRQYQKPSRGVCARQSLNGPP